MKIAIAGAGLLGRLLAFRLLESDRHEITLYDRDRRNGDQSCAMTAAGMISPYAEFEKSNAVIAKIGLRSLEQWPLILDRLEASVCFKQQGSLVTAHHQDSDHLALSLQRVARLHATSPFCAINPRDLEPEINAINPWYYFPNEGQIDSQQLMQKLEFFLTPRLNWLMQQEVIGVRPNTIVLQHKNEYYDFVFDCRGMGAVSNFPKLRAVRGEVVWLHAPLVNLSRPIRLMHPRYGIYIVPRANHHYLIGASEIESLDYSPISVRTMLELLTAAYSIHKSFVDARVVRSATNCRPTLPDHLPKIIYNDGLLAINGLYRHGFLLAPQLIQDVIYYLNSGIEQVQYKSWWEKYHD